jgi:hypothetical protein
MGEACFNKAPGRSYLFGAAEREVHTDHARRKAADRRGGGRRRVSLNAVVDYHQGHELAMARPIPLDAPVTRATFPP